MNDLFKILIKANCQDTVSFTSKRYYNASHKNIPLHSLYYNSVINACTEM